MPWISLDIVFWAESVQSVSFSNDNNEKSSLYALAVKYKVKFGYIWSNMANETAVSLFV